MYALRRRFLRNSGTIFEIPTVGIAPFPPFLTTFTKSNSRDPEKYTMNRVTENTGSNRLGTDPPGRLIWRFALPAVAGNLVDALYNITDQIFIGHGVGMIGNAATNVAFPITTIATAVSLLIGVGAAASFNLAQGRGDLRRAARIAGNGISLAVICGVALSALFLLLLKPLLVAFGATESILPAAHTYTGITSFALPFLIFKGVCSQLIRSDSSPAYSMFCLMSGAILNVLLDPLFIFIFDMGIAGAAWATLISQAFSALMALLYIRRFRTVRLTRRCFVPERRHVAAIASLGAAASINQIAITLVHVTMNNVLGFYGALSEYGSDAPLAVTGVISKVNVVIIAFTVGISQGCQPIFGYNYGAGRFDRVRRTFRTTALLVTAISAAAYVCLQAFPREIVSLFGHGDAQYMAFGERYLRIYMSLMLLNGILPLTSNFLTAIGKASKGVFLSLMRQIVMRLPLIVFLPRVMGIEGALYAGPAADLGAVLLAAALLLHEFRKMPE